MEYEIPILQTPDITCGESLYVLFHLDVEVILDTGYYFIKRGESEYSSEKREWVIFYYEKGEGMCNIIEEIIKTFLAKESM